MPQSPAPASIIAEDGVIPGEDHLTSLLRFFNRIQATVEIGISIALVVVTLVFMAPIFQGMATTSLGTDERGTVTSYSSRGPFYTITRYNLAKNHVFFNFLNSITPGSKSLNSLRVRIWSFAFFGAAGIAILIYFVRRGWFFEGALLVYFLGVNPELVTLNLMARGYGFLGFVTLALAILTTQYFENGDQRVLKAICVLTVLGVWTIPSFLIFGGSLLVFLLLATRSREVLRAGVATGAAILILYAPILLQVLKVMHDYQGRYGEEYATMEAVDTTLRVYLLPLGDNVLFALLFGAFIAPFALWTKGEPIGRALRVMMGAVGVFFVVCLTMKTPPIRTTALTIGPILFCLVHAFGHLLRNARVAPMRPLVVLGIAVPLLLHATHARASYRFLPMENYLDVARAIEMIFPKGTTTYGGSNTISAYVEDRYLDLKAFDKAAFLEGKSVVIHSQTNFLHNREVRVEDLSPRMLNIQIPQRKGDFQTLCFVPPLESGVAEIVSPPGSARTGWILSTPGTLSLKFHPDAPIYSLNVLVKGGSETSLIQADAEVNGSWQRMQSYQGDAGRIYSLRLPKKALADAKVCFSSPTPGAAVSVADVWTYPAGIEKEGAR